MYGPQHAQAEYTQFGKSVRIHRLNNPAIRIVVASALHVFAVTLRSICSARTEYSSVPWLLVYSEYERTGREMGVLSKALEIVQFPEELGPLVRHHPRLGWSVCW